jgi:hypothetical protein
MTYDFCDFDFEDDNTPIARQGLVPEKVTANKGFFSALAMADIKVIGADLVPKFEPHQRRFNLLEEVVLCTSPNGIIEKVEVPDMMCDFLPKDIYKDMSVFNGMAVSGDGASVCTAARDKLDGVECVVFGTVTNKGTFYYLWDDKSIKEVEANQPFVCEKIGDEYIVLSVVSDDFWSGVTDKVHKWSYLSKDMLDSSKEGVVLMVHDREYKVVREKTFTLQVKNKEALDSTGKSFIVGIDCPDGLYDFNEFDQVVKKRPREFIPILFSK